MKDAAPLAPPSLWKEVDERFDLAALLAFLRVVVRDHPTVDGVAISGTRIGDSWAIDESWMPVGLSAGDWTFQRGLGNPSEFSLSYRHSPESAIVCRCRLEKRDVFSLVSIKQEPLVALSVSSIKI